MTKEELIEKVNNKDKNWFGDLLWDDDLKKKVGCETVYEQSYGDGNDYIITYYFHELNMFIRLDGTYSSFDSPYWHSVSFAKPYQFTETRYKKTTLEDIRDEKIEGVLKSEDGH